MITIAVPSSAQAGSSVCITVAGASSGAEVKVSGPDGTVTAEVESTGRDTLKVTFSAPRRGVVAIEVHETGKPLAAAAFAVV